ncbi:MAG: molybdate ABC transporter substrate-binding protein [Actinobacteria bacterium]|nr:molybdate ABC transporter substrate-binding protein [Actinomycetota bacterium]
MRTPTTTSYSQLTAKVIHRACSRKRSDRHAIRIAMLAFSTGLLGTALFGTGCSSTSADNQPANTQSTKASQELSGSILVSAAASLNSSFTQISKAFMELHPKAKVTLNFVSSGQIAAQIEQGAPADIAAIADTAPMQALEKAQLVLAPSKVFARNSLAIVTKANNPLNIRSLADLATVGTVSLCVQTAPCGKFAEQSLTTAGVSIAESNITRGADAQATLRAVTEGDAEAGIVYATDASPDASVAIEQRYNINNEYPIAVTRSSSQRVLAAAFMEFVLSAAGQSILSRAGFLAP